jgi:hypothetical protein
MDKENHMADPMSKMKPKKPKLKEIVANPPRDAKAQPVKTSKK